MMKIRHLFSIPLFFYNVESFQGSERLIKSTSKIYLSGSDVLSGKNDDKLVKEQNERKLIMKNLLSISTHLQNPELYSSEWSRSKVNIVNESEGENHLTTCKDIAEAGEILALYPVHSLGFVVMDGEERQESHFMHDISDEMNQGYFSSKQFVKSVKEKKERNNNYRKALSSKFHLDIPLFHTSSPKSSSSRSSSYYIEANPNLYVDGWVGHLADVGSSTTGTNCIAVPISPPLCALVSTKPMPIGTRLVRQLNPKKRTMVKFSKCIQEIENEYHKQISELNSYISMAYPSPPPPPIEEFKTQSQSSQATVHYEINQNYPGLVLHNSDPDIYLIKNFLTEDECDRIICKSEPNLVPCLIKNEKTGKVEQDPSRTSMNANIPQNEVPTILQKLTNLCDCKPENLEILQVLKYSKGQLFRPHTDGFDELTTACGFVNAHRLVTVFCYLNDVPNGGSTRFTKIFPNGSDDDASCLEIKPTKGMAVVHFPVLHNSQDQNHSGYREDKRTEHEGSTAIDDKWVLTTWLWSSIRSDDMYAETRLQTMSNDII